MITFRQITPHQTPWAGQIYSRALFSAGYGYPMWYPRIGPDLPSPYEKRGICIGDVGILSTVDGQFCLSFNMFLPHDDPLNSLAVLSPPPGYVPLSPPSESEIVSMPDYFLPGSVVASKGTEITRVSETPLYASPLILSPCDKN